MGKGEKCWLNGKTENFRPKRGSGTLDAIGWQA